MDTNSITNNLNRLFQEVTLNSITSENVGAIELFLTSIIDSNNYQIFNDHMFLNLIFLLETQESSSYVIKHLLREVKLKSLRLMYTQGSAETSNECCYNQQEREELPWFTDLPALPAEGEISFAKTITQQDGQEIIKTYKIDHTGRALELVNTEINEYNEELETLNDSMLERVLKNINDTTLSDFVPLTEDDL